MGLSASKQVLDNWETPLTPERDGTEMKTGGEQTEGSPKTLPDLSLHHGSPHSSVGGDHT